MAFSTMTIDHDYDHFYGSNSLYFFINMRLNIRWNSHGHSQKPSSKKTYNRNEIKTGLSTYEKAFYLFHRRAHRS